MSDNPIKPKFYIEDFLPVFKTIQNEQYGIIGGHAISYWAEKLLSNDDLKKLSFIPILSKDLDLRSSQAEKVATIISEKLHCPKPVCKNIKDLPGIDNPDELKKFLYVVHVPINGHQVGIDVFRMVPKLDQKSDSPEPAILHSEKLKDGTIVKIWDPITLFKTKAHTYMDRVALGTWKDRNDLLHIKALELIIPAYLKRVSEEKGITPSWHISKLKKFLTEHQGKIPLTHAFIEKYGVSPIKFRTPIKNNSPTISSTKYKRSR